MKKNLGKILGRMLALAIIFSTVGASVYAADNGQNPSCMGIKAIKDSIKVKSEYKTKDLAVTAVTDPNEMDKLMKVFNAVAPKGKRIQKIELCEPLIDTNTNTNTNVIGPAAFSDGVTPQSWDTTGYYIKSVTDLGTGWYFPSSPYMDNWWQGPDTAKISQTASVSATANTSLGVSASDITASVGFNVTNSYSVTLSSQTSVPSGKTLEVKTYITYQKKSYDVWESNLFEANKYYTTGYAFKPLGSYFAKFWY